MKTNGFWRSSYIDCAVSSVVEHFLDTEGVTGSNPVSRTIFSLDHFEKSTIRAELVLGAPILQKSPDGVTYKAYENCRDYWRVQ